MKKLSVHEGIDYNAIYDEKDNLIIQDISNSDIRYLHRIANRFNQHNKLKAELRKHKNQLSFDDLKNIVFYLRKGFYADQEYYDYDMDTYDELLTMLKKFETIYNIKIRPENFFLKKPEQLPTYEGIEWKNLDETI